MPRIRSVHPSLFTDEAFVSLSDAAQIFLIGLWTEADDQGLFEWKPMTLRMRLRPSKDGDVEPFLSEIEAAGCIRHYEKNGRKYGAIRNFRKFQRPKTPNAIHPIDDDLRNYVGLSQTISESPPLKPAPFPPKGEKPPQMEDEGGRMKDVGDIPPKPPKGRVRETDPEFENWWCQYPRRVGKGQALKAYGYAKLKTDAATLLNGAMRYAAERTGEDVRFTKHPATWLNGQCWLDEPETTIGKVGKRPADPEAQRRTDQAAVLAACGFDAGMAGGMGADPVSRTGGGAGDVPGGDSGGDRGGTGDAGTGKPRGPRRGAAQAAGLLPGVRDERAAGTHGPAGDLVGTSGGHSGGPAGRGREPDDAGMEVPIPAQACGPESGNRARPDGAAETVTLGTDCQTGNGIAFAGAETGAGSASHGATVSAHPRTINAL